MTQELSNVSPLGPRPQQQISTINDQIRESEAAAEKCDAEADRADELADKLASDIRDLKRASAKERRTAEKHRKLADKLRAKRTVWLRTAHELQVIGD